MATSPPSTTSSSQPLQLVQMRDLLLSLPPYPSSTSNLSAPSTNWDNRAFVRQMSNGRTVSLPMDVVFLILSLCDVKTLVTCRLVSRRFNTFISNQKSLLYILAVGFEHQIDNPCYGPSCPTSYQKLQRLRRQSLAWRGELPPAMKVNMPVATVGPSFYELNGGLFALLDATAAESHPVAFPSIESSGKVLEGRWLEFVRLPSAISGDLRIETDRVKLKHGMEIMEITINVELDLLVLVERKVPPINEGPCLYRVHILSLAKSTADLEPHPLAHSPVLEYQDHVDRPTHDVELAVFDNHIGLLIAFTQRWNVDRLIIWNWQDGKKAVKFAKEETLESFVFIRKGLILMPSRDNPTLVIYAYKLSPGIGGFQAILSLGLPALTMGLEYNYIVPRTQISGLGKDQRGSNGAQDDPSIPSVSGSGDVLDEETFETPTNRPLHSIPFSPIISDSIIVVSTRVAFMADEVDAGDPNYKIPDSEGTLVIKKSTIFQWLQVWKETIGGLANANGTVGHSDSTQQQTPTGTTAAHKSSEDPNHDAPLRTEPTTSRQTPQSAVLMSIPWGRWMHDVRWLPGYPAPRWIRDVYGMRFATRVSDIAPEEIHSRSPPPDDDPERFLAHDLLPTMVQMFSQVGHAHVIIPPTGPGLYPLPSNNITTDTQTTLQSTPPPGIVQEDPVYAPITPQYRTRIYDFNLAPNLRPPRSVPYPEHMDMSMELDYSQILGDSEVPLNPQTETQSSIQRNRRFLMERENTDKDATIDRGWSSIGRERDLEWTRRAIFEPTYIPTNTTYAEPILTRMPYLEITSRFSNQCSSLMMDAERIVVMETDESNKLAKMEVLVV